MFHSFARIFVAAFLVLSVLVAAAPASAANVDPRGLTNGQRIARGMPPLKPKRLYGGPSKAESAARVRRSAGRRELEAAAVAAKEGF